MKNEQILPEVFESSGGPVHSGHHANPSAAITHLFLSLQIGIPIVWGLLAVFLGQDVNGDQLNYHYYGASSVLNGRFSHDIAAGGLAGYNNPLMYFPFAIAVDYLPAKTVCFAIGVWQGLNIALILAIARKLMRPANAWSVALCIVIVGYLATTPIFLFTVGRTFGDDWASVPFLAGILQLIRDPDNRRHDLWGGILIGLSAGLKITNVPAAGAFVLALAVAYPSPKKLATTVGAMGVGFLAAAGWWLMSSYQQFGSPLFPYYNAFFRSSLYPEVNFRDTRWQLVHFWDLLTLPIRMAQGTTAVIEANYQDTRWLTFFFLFVASMTSAGVNFVRSGASAIGRNAILVSVFCAAAFVIWACMLHYVRYLMVAELVLALAIAMLLRFLCGSDRSAVVAFSGLMLVSSAVDHYLPSRWARIEASGSWYKVSDLKIPSGSAVILGNDIGFVEQALPHDTTLIGLGTNYFFAGLPGDGGAPSLLQQISDVLWSDPAKVYQLTLLSLPLKFSSHVPTQLGFIHDPGECREVPTNLGPLQICRLSPMAQRPAAPVKLTPQ